MGLERFIPTVSEASILLGGFEMVPGLRGSLWPQFCSAVRAGVTLDDCVDFDHRARVISVNPDSRWCYSDRFHHNVAQHILSFPQDRAFLWFLDGIVKTESAAMDYNISWSPERAKLYRESVNAIWAVYIGSLFDPSVNLDTDASLQSVVTSERPMFAHMLIANKIFHESLAEDVKRKMFFGSMLFQVVSDYAKRDFAIENGIPSFGGIGYEGLSDTETLNILGAYKQEYLDEAIAVGMDKTSLIVKMKLLDFAKQIPRQWLFTKSLMDWHNA